MYVVEVTQRGCMKKSSILTNGLIHTEHKIWGKES